MNAFAMGNRLKMGQRGWLALIAILLLSGCASQRNTRSGFLERYEELETTDEKRSDASFMATGVDWSAITRGKLESVELHVSDKLMERFSEEDRTRLAEESLAIARERFEQLFRLDSGGEHPQVCIRIAITDFDAVNVGLNAVTGLLAVPVDNGGVSVELEILEVASRRRLLAMAAHERGKVTQVGGFFSRFGHATSGFRRIVDRAAARVESARMPSVSPL